MTDNENVQTLEAIAKELATCAIEIQKQTTAMLAALQEYDEAVFNIIKYLEQMNEKH